MASVLGVDIGGSKVLVGVVDANGHVHEVQRRATGAELSSSDLLEAVRSPMCDLMARHDVAAIGVGCPGPMTRGATLVSPLNLPQWRDFALRDTLAEFGLPVVVDNDVKALARGEGWVGAARGCQDYISVVVSTGIGGAVVVGGRVIDGASGNAGHIGHVVVVPDGERCACGARGCVEAEASGSAVARRSGRNAAAADESQWRRSATLVGRALASVAVVVDPTLIAVGGGFALGIGEGYITAVRDAYAAAIGMPFAREVSIVASTLGRDGGVVGAAALAFELMGDCFELMGDW